MDRQALNNYSLGTYFYGYRLEASAAGTLVTSYDD